MVLSFMLTNLFAKCEAYCCTEVYIQDVVSCPDSSTISV